MASTSRTVTERARVGITDPGQAEGLERPAPRSRAEITRSIEARESLWLDGIRRGYSIKEIARREGLGCRRIQHGVARARERENVSLIRDSRLRTKVHKWGGAGTVNSRGGVWEDPRRPPRLVPLFPIGPFTPQSTCPHRGPIRPGSVFCCMVCSGSGMDGHPALKRDPRTDPCPEPKVAAPAKPGTARETRKQRRQRLHAARQAALVTAADPGQKGERRK